jgi:hypothetical protein
MEKRATDPVEIVKAYGKELSCQNKFVLKGKIICLGLGNLELRAPKYQLAFLLEISNGREIHAYDPIWKDSDINLLKNYSNINLIPLESYKVSETTLFVMFHCPHELLDKIVESNNDRLDLIILLCNDLSDYKTSSKYKNLAQAATHDNLVKTSFELEQFHSNVFTGSFWHSWTSLECSDDLINSIKNIEI